LQGYDPAFSRMSPGVLMLGMVIEDALASGARAIDFLRGREPYKYLWGACDRPGFKRLLSRGAPARAMPASGAAS